MKLFTRKFGSNHATSRFFAVRIFVVGFFICFSIFGTIVYATAGVPKVINFQGRLMDSSGNLLGGPSGTDYCFKFSIYDATTSGSKIWPAGSPTPGAVLVREGVFDGNIGVADTLNLAFTDDQAYVDVAVSAKSGTCDVGEVGESYETLSPRPRIVSSAFALNSATVGGFTPAQSASGNQLPALTSDALVLGGTSAGVKSTGSNALTFNSGATGDIQFFSSSNKITSSGNLTIAGILASGGVNITGASTTALTVANTGSNYAFQVDTNTASSVTGLKVTANTAGNGVALAAISSGSNEFITLDAKGTGEVRIGGSSTGNVLLAGGSGATGCTIDNSNGNLTCAGTISGTGGVGYWTRSGTTISPATANDILSISTNSTTASNKAIEGLQTGATSGTDYAGYFSNTGAATTNVGLYATASGGTENIAAFFENGSVGVGAYDSSVPLYVSSSSASTLFKIFKSTGDAGISFGVEDLATDIGRIQGEFDNGPADLLLNPAGGNIGIGTTAPQAKTHIVGTTEQVRVGYDATKYFTTTVGSSGQVMYELSQDSSWYWRNGIGSQSLFIGSSFDGYEALIKSTDGNAQTGLSLRGDLVGTNVSFILSADDDTNPIVSITGDALAQTLTFDSANHTFNGNVGIGDATPDALFTVGTTSQFQVNSSGAIAAATGITSSGTITFSGLGTNSAVYTNGSSALTTTAPTSGTIGYWSRSGTTLSPATANDILSVSTNSTTASNKAIEGLQTGATSGTDYAGYFSNTGAATTNVGLYATATGATNNYAAIFEDGGLSIGLPVDNSYNFQVTDDTRIKVGFDVVNKDYYIGDTNETYLHIDEVSFEVIGDVEGTNFSLDNTNQLVNFSGFTDYNFSTPSYPDNVIEIVDNGTSSLSLILGDVGDNGNGTKISFDDNAQTIYLNAVNGFGIGDTTPDDLLNIHSATAAAGLAITSLGTDTDPYIKFELADGTSTFTLGVDDSDSDKFKISTTALGTNDRFVIDSSGNTVIGVLDTDLTAPTTSGTTRCVITDANGQLSFTTCGGGVNWDAIGDPSTDADIAFGTTAQTITSTATTQNPLSLIGNSLTTGSLLTLTGDRGADASTAGLFESVATVNTSASGVANNLYIETINSNTVDPNSVYGINNVLSDATNLDNEGSGIISDLTISGSGSKSYFGVNSIINSSSTGVEDFYGVNGTVVSSGARTTGTSQIFGLYGSASTSNSNGATINVYGVYASAGGTVDSGTINAYGLYIENGSSDTTGTSTKYGLYVADQTGADNNYAAVFAGGNVGIGDTTPDDLLNIHSATASAGLAITSLGTDTDPYIKFELADGTSTFTLGVDDSDSDKFKISTTALGTNDRFVIDSSGNTTIGVLDTDLTAPTTSGTTRCVITDANGQLSFTTCASGISDADYGDIVVSGSGTVWSIDADVIDWADIADSMTLDAATDINLGANALSIDLDSTGDFSIRDVTTDIATFADSGAITFAPTSGEDVTLTFAGNGRLDINPVTYENNIGAVDISRSGNFTGVAGETAIDLSIKPAALTLTEPSSGTFTWNGASIDMSNISVTADSGSSTLNGIYVNGVNDSDAGTIRGIYLQKTSGTGNSVGIEVSANWNYSAIFAGNVGIGDNTPAAPLTVGSGDAFQVSSAGTVLQTSAINAFIGYDLNTSVTSNFEADDAIAFNIDFSSSTTDGGDTVTAFNVGNFATANGSVTETAIKIGTGWDTILDTPALDISTAGVISGATGITSSGTITFSGLGTSSAVYTNGSSQLTTTAPTSGTIGYWSRSSTTLSPATANDILSVSTNSTTSGNKAIEGLQTGATSGTDYAGYFSNTGAATTNVGLYATATGATNNYAAIFEAGEVLVGSATDLGSYAFQVTGNTIIDSGTLTVPGAGTNSERFGASSLSAGNNSVAFGNSASSAGADSTALGKSASAASQYNLAIGASASATDTNSVAIGALSTASGGGFAFGRGASATAANAITFGTNASNSGINSITIGGTNTVSTNNTILLGVGASGVATSIAIGTGAAATAANQFVVGTSSGSGMYISNVFFGNGVTAATPQAYTINGSGGLGTDIAGGNISIAGGKGTGNAAGGYISFLTSDAGSTGTTLQTLTEKMRLNVAGELQIGSTTDLGAYKLQITGDTYIDATGDLRFGDTTGGEYVGFQAPGTVTGSVVWTLPAADASGCFQSNGSGTITIASCGSGGGADTALSNLASVAINTSLLPGSDDAIDLGSDTLRFRDLFLGGETLHIGTSTSDEGVISYTTSSNILSIGSTGTVSITSNTNLGNNILENIGNAGTDFIATTGALNLAGVLTANGGVTVASGQSLTLAGITGSTQCLQVNSSGVVSGTGSACGGGGGVSDGDKGDIVVSGSGAVWDIDADVIDFTEIADSLSLDASTDINLGANAFTIDLDSTGDFSVRDGTTDFALFDDTGGITFAPNGTSDFTLTLDNDSSFIQNATVTDSGFIQDINLVLGDDAAIDTVTALNIDVTSAATGDADTLRGLTLSVSSADATVVEEGLVIGSGWDTDIRFLDTTPEMALADNGTLILSDGSSTTNDIFQIGTATSRGNALVYGDLVLKGGTITRSLTGIIDVFVYDTAGDSDSGDWRNSLEYLQRSWATETKDDGVGDACNIASDDRCGGAAFPRKAILVTTASALYIFDASDNSLWMKFTQDGTYALGADSNNNPSGVAAQNGVIVVGTNGSSATGMYAIDFKQDAMYRYNTTNRAQSDTNIGNRNSTATYATNAETGFAIINNTVNDVSINVQTASMENRAGTLIAPVDSQGGPLLGVTLIAAATDSGVSVINMGTRKVVSYSDATNDDYNQVYITKRGRMYATNETRAQLEEWRGVDTVITAQTNGTPTRLYDETLAGLTPITLAGAVPTISTSPSALAVIERASAAREAAAAGQIDAGDVVFVGTDQGLAEVHTSGGALATASWSKITTKDDATPYMNGGIRSVYLFDDAAGATSTNSAVGATGSTRNPMDTAGATSPTFGANGIRGGSVNFNNNSYLCSDADANGTCDSDTDNNVSTTSFTVSLWFKHSTTAAADVLFERCYTPATPTAAACVYAGMTTTGTITAGIDDDATWTTVGTLSMDDGLTSSGTWNDGQWHHLLLTNTDTDLCMYIDGRQAVACDTAIAASATLDAAQVLTIGGRCTGANCATGDSFWDGEIDEFTWSAGATTSSGSVASAANRRFLDGRTHLIRPQTSVTNADITTSTTIGSSSESYVPNSFAGLVVEITGGTGAGQTRNIISNTATTFTVYPAWSTTPDSTSDFRVSPSKLYGSTNTVTAIAVDAPTQINRVRNLYVGTNDGSDGGGVSVFTNAGAGGIKTEVYSSDSGIDNDDFGTAWSGTDADDINAIASFTDTIVFGTGTGLRSQRKDLSLKQMQADMFTAMDDIRSSLVASGLFGATQEVLGLGQGADLAEYYYSNTPLEAGDVVAIQPDQPAGIGKSTSKYQKNLLGVVSTKPGLTLGPTAENAYPIALSGRIPVKVTDENGIIKVGDLLTSSSRPGYAMRATSAGPIIGRVLNEPDYDQFTSCDAALPEIATTVGDGPGVTGVEPSTDIDQEIPEIVVSATGPKCGYVMLFAGLGESLGKNVEILAAEYGDLQSGQATIDGITTTLGTQSSIMSFLRASKADLLAKAIIPESIFSDRIAAGMEILTPTLYADDIYTKTITALDGGSVALIIGENGKFEVRKDESTPATITLDALGNAVFSGKVTAAEIDSAKITGFDALIERITALETLLQANAFDSLTSVTTQNLKATGDSSFEGKAQFAGLSFFSNTTTFDGGVVFGAPVEFNLPPIFNKDTAGFAIIKEGARKVEVVFNQPYIAQPVTSASISLEDIIVPATEVEPESIQALSDSDAQAFLDQGISYIITNKTTKGFTIRINKNAPRDIRFSWTAFAVKDPSIFESIVDGLIINPPVEENTPPEVEEGGGNSEGEEENPPIDICPNIEGEQTVMLEGYQVDIDGNCTTITQEGGGEEDPAPIPEEPDPIPDTTPEPTPTIIEPPSDQEGAPTV